MITKTINKYSVLICLVISVLFIIVATYYYPGGSMLDQNSVGFHWTKNFLSNLFGQHAINGSPNPGWIWALIGMAFHSVGYGLFFIHMSKKLAAKQWANILKFVGFSNMILIFLIATSWHDIGTFSIVLTLVGLFIITIFALKSKYILIKFCCIIVLLTYYVFFFFYGFGYVELAIIMQKVYIVGSLLLVLGLEYFTNSEGFV